MKILTTNNYYTKTQQDNRKSNGVAIRSKNGTNLNAPSKIMFNGLSSRHGNYRRIRDFDKFDKTFKKLFDTRSTYDYYEHLESPLCKASSQLAQRAREFCFAHNHAGYIPQLYLYGGDKYGSVFCQNLHAKDLSAVPDVLLGIEQGVSSPQDKQKYYKMMLDKINFFVGNYGSKDNYYTELCNLYYHIESKFYNAGGAESSLMNEHIYMNHRGNVSNFMNFNGGYGYIVPSPKAFTTPEKVLQAINNPTLKSQRGEPWNQNGNVITTIADIVPTSENKESYSKMIEALKGLDLIDYNQRDLNGISVLEKVMNSENYEFLELLKGKNVDYSPELDIVYENIKDENFKNKLKELNLNFPEIENAIRSDSDERLRVVLRHQMKSPLMSDAVKNDILYKILRMPSTQRMLSTLFLLIRNF